MQPLSTWASNTHNRYTKRSLCCRYQYLYQHQLQLKSLRSPFLHKASSLHHVLVIATYSKTKSNQSQSVKKGLRDEMQFASPAQAVEVATRSIFERWTALKLTIEHQCGGIPDKARELLDNTIAMAIHPQIRHTEDHFIDMFYAVFDSMDTDVEDGSPEQVAAHIVRIRDAAAKGDYGPANDVVQKSSTSSASMFAESTKTSIQQQNNGGMNTEYERPSPPVVDEDGFTEVRRSHRNH